MSTRTTLRPATIINAQSMAADITSDPTVLNSISGVSYEASWSGTSPVGTLSAQVSNSYALSSTGAVINAGVWTTVALVLDTGLVATSVPVTGNTGSVVINLTGVQEYAIRLFYDAASGVGTMSAVICGKVS